MASPKEGVMNLEERIDRLEKLWEKWYQTYELLNFYVPRMTEANIRYLEGCTDYYFAMERDVSKLRDILGGILDDLQLHYKTHNLDKKKKEEYAFKRKRTRY